MNLDLVRKNSAYKRFLSDVKNHSVSHAYIIFGEDDALRDAFFTLASMSLLCPTACGECSTCIKVMEGNYVELIRLNGADKLGTKDINALLEKVYIKCVVGDKKIVVIDNADMLSLQAQNKLLKTYEEPPTNLIMFLGATHENGLVATLRSRGKKLFLEDIPAKDIVRELIENGENPSIAETASTCSMGNYSKAERFCKDESFRDLYEKTFEMMTELKKSSQLPEYVYGGLFEKETVLSTLDFMEIILCDIMKKVANSNAPMFTLNREYDLKRASEGYTAQSVAMAINAVGEMRKKLASNINAYSASGAMLMDILEAKYKWRKK